jgi:cellulose synthase operon protein C
MSDSNFDHPENTQPLISEPSSDQLANILRLIEAKKRESTTREVSPAGTSTSLYGAYHEAAAVLSNFDPETLQPVPGNPSDDRKALELDCTSINNGNSQALHLSIRQTVLKQLLTNNRLEAALQANPNHAGNLIDDMLKMYVQGQPPTLEQQEPRQLAATLQIAVWFDGQLPGLPSKTTVAAQLDWLELMRPFTTLVGDHFGGREKELRRLREYVDALPSQSFSEWFTRGLGRLSGPNESPLLIVGLGGMGKSTLLSKFILDHTRRENPHELPFVYMDFDRPGLSAQEPITLLIEMARQLGLQFAHARDAFNELCKAWREQLRNTRSGRDSRKAPLDDLRKQCVAIEITQRPFLLVLDTFEEVQSHSQAHVRELGRFFSELQSILPRLRVVIAGRARIDPNDFPTETLELGDLDLAAAQGYLQARGVSDARVAKAVASQVGGNPLTLRLAANLIEKEGTQDIGLTNFKTGFFWVKLDSSEIQRILYGRILDHVHDPEVKLLAHPGLVLRRITPELIQQVMAEPCGIIVDSSERAHELFDKLKLEVSLISVDSDGALRHRSDVRRMMIQHMQRTKPKKVNRIHQLAVDYYKKRESNAERAEEFYHRLALRQPSIQLDTRWRDELKSYFGEDTLQELEPIERAYLSSRLGLTVPNELSSELSLDVWERSTEKSVRDYLQLNDLEPALKALRSRSDRSTNSPLFLLEAAVLTRLVRLDEALKVINQGLEMVRNGGHAGQYLDLLLATVPLYMLINDFETANARLNAAESAVWGADGIRRLTIGVRRLQLADRDASPATDRNELIRTMNGLVLQLPSEDVRGNSALILEALAEKVMPLIPREWSKEELRPARILLAYLFPTRDQQLKFAKEASLKPELIQLSASSETTWFSILNEAIRQHPKGVDAVIQTVLKLYPASEFGPTGIA